MSEESFNFDELAKLAQSDPEAFEKKRLELISKLIDGAPESLRKRLVGFQWRIDMERQRCDNPLQACIRISNMMWDMIYADRGFLWSLQALSDPSGALDHPMEATNSAEVLSFKPPRSQD